MLSNPMSSQNYADAVAALEKQKDEIGTRIRLMYEGWGEDHCPFKIGDVVVGNDYSHNGKRIKVERIYASDHLYHSVPWAVKWKWVASGPVLLKNGNPGRNYARYAVAIEGIKDKPSDTIGQVGMETGE